MAEIVWIQIESNPELMTKMLAEIGVPDEWAVNDVIGLDEELLQFMETPVLSLVLNFPPTAYYKYTTEETESQTKDPNIKDVYFMQQTVGHACGTIALIHSVANNTDRIQLKSGSPLKDLIDSSLELTPEQKGRLLGTNEGISRAHEKCALLGQSSLPNLEKGDSGHFVSFVHKNGFLYELSGGNACPINHGNTSEETFLSDAARICRKYVARDPNNPNFSVLAISRKID